MTFYELRPDLVKFATLEFSEESEIWLGWRDLSATESIADRWNPPPVYYSKTGNTGSRLDPAVRNKTSDFIHLSSCDMVLSIRAANELRDLLLPFGEYLPLQCEEGSFVVYHCMNQIMALDFSRCDGNWSERAGRFLSIRKYAFKPEAVRGQIVFRVPTPNPWSIFVSQSFIDRVNAAGLQGGIFNPQVGGEAVPTPPPASAPIRPVLAPAPPTNRTCNILPEDVAVEIHNRLAEADLLLGIKYRFLTSDELQAIIDKKITEIRGRQLPPDDPAVEHWGTMLGCLWGESVCMKLGWQWSWIRIDGDQAAGIVSPTQSLAVFPVFNLKRILADRNMDTTNLLLYNMLVAGQMPPAAPGALIVLG